MLFAVAAFHQLAIDKPADINPALGLYLNTLSVLGLTAWIYTQFSAPFLRPRDFVMDQVDRHGAVTEMTLRPAGHPLRWQPGHRV